MPAQFPAPSSQSSLAAPLSSLHQGQRAAAGSISSADTLGIGAGSTSLFTSVLVSYRN